LQQNVTTNLQIKASNRFKLVLNLKQYTFWNNCNLQIEKMIYYLMNINQCCNKQLNYYHFGICDLHFLGCCVCVVAVDVVALTVVAVDVVVALTVVAVAVALTDCSNGPHWDLPPILSGTFSLRYFSASEEWQVCEHFLVDLQI
jgi:hypothetical protein